MFKDVKTSKSKRQVSITSYLINKLQLHRDRQKEKYGKVIIHQDIVFCSLEGTFKDPRNLLRDFNRLIVEAGLPKITIHDLRHLHATQLMIDGVNPKVVQERLGHSRVSITLDLYSHVNEDLQVEAAQLFEKNFFI
ncbi:tyrosine-type recombinase/integrase [Bacillus sp. JJ1773]|uniref:tyrosine-type recombinase/integrase n=1 Tax=Bacillus sp. JJ1773 TaxID=3122965 RepID=UPI002FFFFD90